MSTPQDPTRREALGLLGLSALATQQAQGAATPERPNILYIYTDDHSYRTLSCYKEAYPWVKTPNIDALAKSGTRFHGAYLGAWCMPSRASLLTGRQPHGVQSMRMEGTYPGSTYDPKQCPFWPALFRKNGYHTAQIGKWHTGTDAGYGRDWDYQVVWNRPKNTKNAGAYYEPTKSRPWDDAVRRARVAMRAGTLEGILWHQGESDATPDLAPGYGVKLAALVGRFRAELAAPDVPFLIGQLGRFPDAPWDEWRARVDAAQRALPRTVPAD